MQQILSKGHNESALVLSDHFLLASNSFGKFCRMQVKLFYITCAQNIYRAFDDHRILKRDIFNLKNDMWAAGEDLVKGEVDYIDMYQKLLIKTIAKASKISDMEAALSDSRIVTEFLIDMKKIHLPEAAKCIQNAWIDLCGKMVACQEDVRSTMQEVMADIPLVRVNRAKKLSLRRAFLNALQGRIGMDGDAREAALSTVMWRLRTLTKNLENTAFPVEELEECMARLSRRMAEKTENLRHKQRVLCRTIVMALAASEINKLIRTTVLTTCTPSHKPPMASFRLPRPSTKVLTLSTSEVHPASFTQA